MAFHKDFPALPCDNIHVESCRNLTCGILNEIDKLSERDQYMLKAVDIFGYDTMTIVEVEV